MNIRRIVLIAAATAAPLSMGQVRITEYMYDGFGGEYVELTNVGASAVDVTGWSMDDSNRVAGSFPIGSLAMMQPHESVVMCETSAALFASRWNLGVGTRVLGDMGIASGHGLGRNDEINVFDASGQVVDRLTYGDQTYPGSVRARYFSGWCPASALGANLPLLWTLSAVGDVQSSWGSAMGDVGSPGVFTSGDTPAVTAPPVFSHGGGFYQEGFQLGITPAAGAAEIYYTLDGSTPTASSTKLSGTLPIQSRAGQANYYSLIQTCANEIWRPPTSEVFKCTTVRAIAIRPGALPSTPVSASYVVTPTGAARYSMPVISIMSDPDNLWGYDRGIYVPGRIYDENYDPNVPTYARPANYNQEGAAWERTANMEFFESDGTPIFNTGVGLRINGSSSRYLWQKSLRVYFDSNYGMSELNYPIFGDQSVGTFKRLILRNSGADAYNGLCRDDLFQTLVADQGVASQASRFAIVFINGEYWGIQGIRERIDKYYFQYKFGADSNNIDYLELNGSWELKEGDTAHFDAMMSFIRMHDMTNDANIATVETMADLDNLLTYMACEVYDGNFDWPGANLEIWRPRTADGRWQWVIKDTDVGLDWSPDSAATYDSLHRLLVDRTLGSEIFRAVIVNQGVRERFINRFADMLNSMFLPDAVTGHVESFRARLAAEIGEHYTRWHFPYSVAYWANEMNDISNFGRDRSANVRDHIVGNFGLAGAAALTVSSSRDGAAAVTVNTLRITAGSLPWSGVYFKGVPVLLSVQAMPGYCSLGFDGVTGGTNTDVVIDLAADTSVTVLTQRSPDVNNDGGIDGMDIEVFYGLWEDGIEAGDFNGDGGVDGQDVGDFFMAWEGGACASG